MTRESVQALREALEAGPSEGPWTCNRWGAVKTPDGNKLLTSGVALAMRAMPEVQANDRYIAAANPVVIRHLLAQLDAAQRVAEALEGMNGLWQMVCSANHHDPEHMKQYGDAVAALSAWKEAQQ